MECEGTGDRGVHCDANDWGVALILRSLGWLVWLVLAVFVLAFHYGPGQSWLARDRAATLIATAESQAAAATEAQAKAYDTQFKLMDARRNAFVAGVDWQSQPQQPLARLVIAATEDQAAAYEVAAESWQAAADSYGLAIQSLLKVADRPGRDRVEFSASDRQLLESLRWAEARAMVRSGQVFGGIEQLQTLLDLRMAEARTVASSTAGPSSSRLALETESETSIEEPLDGQLVENPAMLPTDAIREELAAAQYVGATCSTSSIHISTVE